MPSLGHRTVEAFNEVYEANGLNQYAEVGGASFNYDPRGNLTSDGSRTFDYDLENRLLSVSEGGSTTGTLSYDPLGRLHAYTTSAGTAEFLYDGDRLVGEFAAGQLTTPLRRYADGPGVDEPLLWYEGSSTASGQNWLIADRQGSIIATTDSTGAATTYAYDPYGRPREWSGPRFRYTGQAALPELQLYHYKARVYDPGIGRFLQTDPVGYEGGDLNLYAYVRNDPLNLSDPTGRQAFDSLATRQIYEDEQAVLRGQMSISEYNERAAARAEAAIAAAPLPLAGAARFARGVNIVAARWAQTTFRETFSRSGQQFFQRTLGINIRTVDDLAGALRSGRVNPSQVQVNVVVRDGETVILNTRSAQALERANVPRSEWNVVNRTGDEAFEGMLNDQLRRNQLPQTGTRIRPRQE